MDDTADLLNRIEAYCREHGIEPTTFGIRAANDGKLVGRLRDGRTITLRTLSAIHRQLTLPASESARASETAA